MGVRVAVRVRVVRVRVGVRVRSVILPRCSVYSRAYTPSAARLTLLTVVLLAVVIAMFLLTMTVITLALALALALVPRAVSSSVWWNTRPAYCESLSRKRWLV